MATPETEPPSNDSSGPTAFVEQLINRVIRPLDLLVLTRDRIQEAVDEATARGRVTRDDANELVAELVRIGRKQTDDLLSDLEQLFERGRDQLGTATKQTRLLEPLEQLLKTADRAMRSVGAGPFPISGYDDLTARQVNQTLAGLTPAELRRIRVYEARHANRKTVLDAIDRALG